MNRREGTTKPTTLGNPFQMLSSSPFELIFHVKLKPTFSGLVLREDGELLSTIIPRRIPHLLSLRHSAGASSTRIKPTIFSCTFSKHIFGSQGHSTELRSSVLSFLRFHSTIQPAWEDGEHLLKLERIFTGFIHLLCSHSKSGFTCISSGLSTPLIKIWLTNHFHGNRQRCYMP